MTYYFVIVFDFDMIRNVDNFTHRFEYIRTELDGSLILRSICLQFYFFKNPCLGLNLIFCNRNFSQFKNLAFCLKASDSFVTFS